MRKFDKTDFEKVRHLEPKFESAINSRYVTGLLQDDLKTVAAIYKECLNRQANIACGSCVLQMMTQVGRLYRAYKETNSNGGKKRKRSQDTKR